MVSSDEGFELRRASVERPGGSHWSAAARGGRRAGTLRARARGAPPSCSSTMADRPLIEWIAAEHLLEEPRAYRPGPARVRAWRASRAQRSGALHTRRQTRRALGFEGRPSPEPPVTRRPLTAPARAPDPAWPGHRTPKRRGRNGLVRNRLAPAAMADSRVFSSPRVVKTMIGSEGESRVASNETQDLEAVHVQHVEVEHYEVGAP